jgi:hypothetical protein
MSAFRPGTREYVKALRDSQPDSVGAGVAVHPGSALHRKVVDPRVKVGSRAYREETEALAEEPEVLVLTFNGEGAAADAGKASFTVAGGVAPYSFEPDDGEDPVEIAEAGDFTYTYAADGSYDVEIVDSAPPRRVQADELTVEVDWVA